MNWDLGLGNNQIFIDNTPFHEARWPNIDPGYEELYKDSAYIQSTSGGTYKLKGYALNPASYNLKESDLVADPSNLEVDNTYSSTISYKVNSTTNILEPLNDSSGVKFGYYTFQNLPAVDLSGALINGALGENWGLQTSKIINQFGDKINIRYQRTLDELQYQPNINDKINFWGKLELLDNPYEFFKDQNYLYIKPPDGKLPQNLNLSTKKRSVALNIQNSAKYIKFDGISVIGGSVSIAPADFITLESMDMEYLYHRLLRQEENISSETGLGIYGEGNIIKNNTIKYSSGTLLRNEGWKGRIENNIVEYGGYFPTWGTANIGNGGDENIIKNNTIKYSGRFGLNPAGRKNKFLNNVISDSIILTKDGGAVYNWSWAEWPNYTLSENEIAYNIISDSKDDVNRVGIYLDNGATGYKVHHNIVNGFSEVVRLNTPTPGNQIYNNTFITRRSVFPSWPNDCTPSDYFVQDCFKDVEIKNNILGISNSKFNSILNTQLNFNNVLTFTVDEANKIISTKIDGQDKNILGIYTDTSQFKFSFDPVDSTDLSKGRFIDQIINLFPTRTIPKITNESKKIQTSSNVFASTELSNTVAIPNLYFLNTDLSPRVIANSPIIDKGEVIAGITDGYVGAKPDIGAIESGKTFPFVGSNLFCAVNNCRNNLIPNDLPKLTMESYTKSGNSWVQDTTPITGVVQPQTIDCYSAVQNNTDIVINNLKMYGLKENCLDAQKLAGKDNQLFVTQQRYKDVTNGITKYYTKTVYSYTDGGNTKFYYPHREYWLEWLE